MLYMLYLSGLQGMVVSVKLPSLELELEEGLGDDAFCNFHPLPLWLDEELSSPKFPLGQRGG